MVVAPDAVVGLGRSYVSGGCAGCTTATRDTQLQLGYATGWCGMSSGGTQTVTQAQHMIVAGGMQLGEIHEDDLEAYSWMPTWL